MRTPDSRTQIMQVDAVLAEDGRSVVLYGHTADDEVTFVQSIRVPKPIDQSHFEPGPWIEAASADRWVNQSVQG